MIGYILIAIAFLLPLYAYVLYPLALILLSRDRAGTAHGDEATNEWPPISITIPVYNEASQISELLESILALDYPPDRRQILVVSDASTDGTDEIIRSFSHRGVELLTVEQRGGKTAAENAARMMLQGEIVINTDASIRIWPGAIKALVRQFADPTVGVASGRDVSVAFNESDGNLGESAYTDYEMRVRALETGVGGIVGASGCLYAIRRDLHRQLLPSALSRDFASALVAREHGYQAVSVSEAICTVPRTQSLRKEYRRKVRTMVRGMETLYHKRHLLNPKRTGRFAWMLFSHKVCRWLVPWSVLLALLGLTVAPISADLKVVVVGITVLGALLTAIGWYWPSERPMPKVVSLPAFAIAANLAALVAGVRALRGELDPIWEPTRRRPAGPAERSSPRPSG